MKAGQLANAATDDIVRSYATAAQAHGRATREGDHITVNHQHDIVAAAYRELRSRGGAAQNALLALLSDEDPAVRGWAAAHALEFSPDDGEPVLESLTRHPGLEGFEAEMTLETWRRGDLRFP